MSNEFDFKWVFKANDPATGRDTEVIIRAPNERAARDSFASRNLTFKKLIDPFTRTWITNQSRDIVEEYADGTLTIRGLHYQLVSRGMTNTMQHYKRVVNAMIAARWDGLIRFEVFADEDRNMDGETDYEETTVDDAVITAKHQIVNWMQGYYKNRWENQRCYVEVLIEKKALLGVFRDPCMAHSVGLGACKGYPSLTFLNDAAKRFKEASEEHGKHPVILYFGDYDPSGEDIPRSIHENLLKLGVDVEVRRVLLMEDQVREMDLPVAPAKVGDSRTAAWDGIGQVELDAVNPSVIREHLDAAIKSIFDEEAYRDLKDYESDERYEYVTQLKEFVQNLDVDQL